MMVEDLVVEAKEASIREVARLLPTPDILQSIVSIKADYITRQQVQIYVIHYNINNVKIVPIHFRFIMINWGLCAATI